MPESTDRTAHWVQSEAEVAELAALVVDPAREKLIVCVTKQPALDRPMLDPDLLATRLGDRADVWVVTESADAWALTESLPPKIDVYGGAVRAWQPIPAGQEPYPSDHPQWTVFGPEDGPRVIEQIEGYVNLADNPPPEFGSEAMGTVTAVRKAGAELTLDTGHPAFASNSHLIQHGDVYHAAEILTPGQEVRVRVGPWHAQAARVSVSLRDFAPDPWERLGEVYEPGQIIDGIVSAIQPYGAFVELLPGVEGLLHKSKIADEFVEFVDDFVRPGDRISVRLLSLDPYAHKAEVSLLDAPAGATPEPPASVFPGGPPWLPASPDDYADDEPQPEARQDDRDRDGGPRPDDRGSAESERAPDGPSMADVLAENEALRARVAELEAQLGQGETDDPAEFPAPGGDAPSGEGAEASAAAPADAEPAADAANEAVAEPESVDEGLFAEPDDAAALED